MSILLLTDNPGEKILGWETTTIGSNEKFGLALCYGLYCVPLKCLLEP